MSTFRPVPALTQSSRCLFGLLFCLGLGACDEATEPDAGSRDDGGGTVDSGTPEDGGGGPSDAGPPGVDAGDSDGGAPALQIVDLAAGGRHVCAAYSDGTAQCLGNNFNGQLGDDTTDPRPRPVPVMHTMAFTSMSAGERHTCAIQADGRLFCWGANTDLQLGVPAVSFESTTPVEVMSDVMEISAGSAASCARSPGGQVSCWGDNSSGEVGTGDFTGRASPFAVPEVTNGSAIAVGGRRSCAIRTGGQVACAGSRTGMSSLLRMTDIAGATDAASISVGGHHVCIVRTNGRVACWGDNERGQLGDGTTTDRETPLDVTLVADAVQVSASAANTCARLMTGQVSCWGDDDSGAVGDSMEHPRDCSVGFPIRCATQPTLVDSIDDAVDISCGNFFCCAARASGDVACWGSNTSSQLVPDNTDDQLVPVRSLLSL